MENETRARYIRGTALCLGLAAGLYMCSGKATQPAATAAAQQYNDRWNGVSAEMKYSMVEEALMKMPAKDLYKVGSKVFSTRFSSGLEDNVLSTIKQYVGDRK
jgi:hypothetical protein